MREIDKLVNMLRPMSKEKDGLGVEERAKEMETDSTGKETGSKGETAATMTIDAAARVQVVMSEPLKKRTAGRPSIRRDKPPYEESSKRTRFCSTCRK